MSIPDYRKTAEQRLESVIKGLLALTVVAAVCLVAGVVTLVWHFAAKFW